MFQRLLRRAGAIVLVCAVPAFAVAQDALPKPKEFYFDADALTTRAIQVRGGGDADRLMQLMQRGGGDSAAAAAQLARLAYDGGRVELGESLYARALSSGSQAGGRNAVLWNQGWDRYRNGDAAGALAAWRAAGIDRNNAPSWVPPTLALALWSLERRDEALQWYAAAVRTEPGQWRDAAQFTALLPDWRDEDRARLAEVLAAWRAAPPAWP